MLWLIFQVRNTRLLIANEFEARQSGVKTPMDIETEEQTATRQMLITQSQYLSGNRADAKLVYNVESLALQLCISRRGNVVWGILLKSSIQKISEDLSRNCFSLTNTNSINGIKSI